VFIFGFSFSALRQAGNGTQERAVLIDAFHRMDRGERWQIDIRLHTGMRGTGIINKNRIGWSTADCRTFVRAMASGRSAPVARK
jgi:hypothetical protein